MLIGELTDSQPLTTDVKFRILGRSLSLQAKAQDSGLRPNLFVANYALMYYFLRFFKRKTRHHFIGSMNAYAYMNDDSTRAFINLGMNVTGVRPYPSVDEDNNLIPSDAIKMVADHYDNKYTTKLNYMLYKFVWQNIDNEEVVRQEKLTKESFAQYFSDMHDNLCKVKMSSSLTIIY
ncbi:hypothetical protein BD408DRAFT_352863 [Parasitella parasitica]|nr:hypothetical protein BD408DRAFT_352863 [Parasitella parasitica]